MDKMKINHERNRLLVKLLWFSAFLSIALSIVTKKPAGTLMSLVYGGVGTSIVITFLTYKKIIVNEVMYVVVVGLAALSFFMMRGTPHITTYVVIYYSMVLVALYQDWKPIILSGVINIALTIYFFFNYNQMFPSCNTISLINFILYIILVTGILVFQSTFSENLRKTLLESNKKTEEGKKVLENMFIKIRNSVKQLNKFSGDSIDNIKITGDISREITKTFSEIASVVDGQAKAVVEITEFMDDENDEIENVVVSSSKMKSISSQTVAAIKSGDELVANLSKDMGSVKNTIDNTAGLMTELNEQTKMIEEILSSITSIAAQTNLLALNAAIEAARAGEAGKGFAVVAEEVRKLAENSQASTERIADILGQIQVKTGQVASEIMLTQNAVNSSLQSTTKVETIFKDISDNGEKVAYEAQTVGSGIKNVKQSSETILKGLETITSTVEETTSSIQEVFLRVEEQDNRIAETINAFNELNDVSLELEKLSS
ncbi:methyl-accepting chemotaxis protein signaling domain protein [Clostridiales bacterium oral taxon 876 str. F0540]|nr:methyl-accepting chemotaxis protein signaling domain protein [Clostridiales bacterium oral taxon 876 str. F0540]